MYKKVFLLIAALTLAILGNISAQNAQELRVNSFLSGNLNSGQEIWYSVRAAEIGVLTVETTGNTDTYLEAFDSNRNLISENDDGEEGTNAQLKIVVSAGRTYLFKLRGYDEDSTGSYRILASQKPFTELRIGTSHNGNIVSKESYWFSVRATQNGYLIAETSGDIDTMLRAYDKNLDFIDSDDDNGNDYNARIEINGKAGETYFFMLSGYDTADGPYQIIASTKPYPAPMRLTAGSFYAGNISAGEDYWFSVQTAKRGSLSVGTTGSTDTYLYAYTSTYDLISENDDGEDTNAFLTIPVEANSTYIFKLKGYSSDISGPYRIIVNFE